MIPASSLITSSHSFTAWAVPSIVQDRRPAARFDVHEGGATTSKQGQNRLTTLPRAKPGTGHPVRRPSSVHITHAPHHPAAAAPQLRLRQEETTVQCTYLGQVLGHKVATDTRRMALSAHKAVLLLMSTGCCMQLRLGLFQISCAILNDESGCELKQK